MPSEELDVPTNFRSQEWEQARDTLDNVFHRIFDLLKANPSLHALVDGRESEPQHKAGDFAVDYRDGNIKLKMSDGKDMIPIGLSALGGTISAAQHGTQSFEVVPGGGSLMHPLAVANVSPGFMSGADKNKLNGLSSSDPSTSIPPTNPIGSAGAIGSSLLYARADHVHPVGSPGTPATIGTAAPGSSIIPARADHVHAHGNQGGGAQHDDVVGGTPGTSGFMTGPDKAKLNTYDGYFTNAAASPPTLAVGHFGIWFDGSGLFIIANGGGTTKKVQLTLSP